MGAWGYGLLDNDGALDELHDVHKATIAILKKLFKKSDPGFDQGRFERLGVLYAVLPMHNLMYDLEYTDIIDKAVADVDFLLTNEDWLSSWKDIKAIKKSLRSFKTKLTRTRIKE